MKADDIYKFTKPGLNGCLLWTRGKRQNGYGFCYVGQRQQATHRVSYELSHGPIPPGYFVCHHCDTPLCINPDHLFAGTQSDNMKDCFQKGRAVLPLVHQNPEWYKAFVRTRPRGSAHTHTIHPDSAVVQIHELRAAGLGPKPIAISLHLAETFVQDIIYGRSRRYLHPDPAIRNRLQERAPKRLR